MSQALTVEKRHSAAAFSGNGALALAPGRLTGPATEAPATTRTRTPLSVVPARPARRKVPFAVFSLLVLAAALATVLMLNISVSGTQYELVQLRNQQTALSQENEALVLAIEAKEAPQNLAAAATKLGMVSSPTFGTIELDSKKVTGTPEPATEGPKPEVLIAAPDLGANPTSPVAGEPAADAASSAESGTIPGPEQLGSGQ
ncbi:hypothetical protein [Arthrobacter antioxidans]|uniref:hypothetical protein n=1 Tax=Arthrobacter antioxidans TaxID=2895818 RepID=UPI001FFF80D1|nr:hypothetical protein [Arthrobacter antioxidans]